MIMKETIYKNINRYIFSNVDKYILILLLITPVLDAVNGVFFFVVNKGKLTNVSPAQIIRMFILAVIIISFYYYKNDNKAIIGALLSLFLIQQIIVCIFYNAKFYSELLFFSKINYTLLLALFLKQYFNDKKIRVEKYIDAMIYSSEFICFVLIITKAFKLGYSSYGKGIGNRGFFVGLNDVTAVLVMVLPFVFYKLIKERNKKKYIFVIIIMCYSLIMLGTKTGLFFLIVVGMY